MNHHRDCERIKHDRYDHIWVCKKHRTLGCGCCHTQVDMENEEYWRDRGFEGFLARHQLCNEGPFRTELGRTLNEILSMEHLQIGMSMIGEIDDKKVLCLIHESEPVHNDAEGQSDEGDDISCVVLTMDEAAETLALNTQEILAMNESCPYILFAIDGMRYFRELGWNEISDIWQKNIDKIASEMNRVRGQMN